VLYRRKSLSHTERRAVLPAQCRSRARSGARHIPAYCDDLTVAAIPNRGQLFAGARRAALPARIVVHRCMRRHDLNRTSKGYRGTVPERFPCQQTSPDTLQLRHVFFTSPSSSNYVRASACEWTQPCAGFSSRLSIAPGPPHIASLLHGSFAQLNSTLARYFNRNQRQAQRHGAARQETCR